MVLPDGHRTPVLVPADGAEDPLSKAAKDGDKSSKSKSSDSESLLMVQKRVADQMFGDRSPMKMEPAESVTPERPADGKKV